eukprot:TRINITY_DN6192_c0_g1_i2.p1 TRINITY_DN6192_c0_g1~~TRINITY_DN6192_c0_g1_i2.p1  ORF type:complete len:506 (-),score=151.45 TRINITY_DN6192_c0_g1_i2:33-1550(-)
MEARREKQRQYQAELALQIAERKAREEDAKRLQREAEAEILAGMREPHQTPRHPKAHLNHVHPWEQLPPPSAPEPKAQALPYEPPSQSAAPQNHKPPMPLFIVGETEQEEHARKQAEKDRWQREVEAQILAKAQAKQQLLEQQREQDRLDDLRVQREQDELAARYAAEAKPAVQSGGGHDSDNQPQATVAMASSPVMHSPRPGVQNSPAISAGIQHQQHHDDQEEHKEEHEDEHEDEESIMGLAAEHARGSPTVFGSAQELRAELEQMRMVAEEAEEGRRVAEGQVAALNQALNEMNPRSHKQPSCNKPEQPHKRQQPARGKEAVLQERQHKNKPTKKKTTAQRVEEVKKRREALEKEAERDRVRKIRQPAQFRKAGRIDLSNPNPRRAERQPPHEGSNPRREESNLEGRTRAERGDGEARPRRAERGEGEARPRRAERGEGEARPRRAEVCGPGPVSYTHLRAHETPEHLVCRLLLEKKKKKQQHHEKKQTIKKKKYYTQHQHT